MHHKIWGVIFFLRVRKWCQTFTKECFEVMCSQGYTLGLCKCIYHIKTHLWANKLQEKYKNKYQDIEKFWNTRWDVQLTLCLVDWYFSPGLPRPTNNQGCIGDKDEEKDEYDEDVWTVEVQHFERKGMNLFQGISFMVYSIRAIQKSNESKIRCQYLQSKTDLFLKYTTVNQTGT